MFAAFLLILMILNFGKGYLVYGKINFEKFQNDSEFLVLTKLCKDEYNINPSAYGLARIREDGNVAKFVGNVPQMEKSLSNYDESKGNIIITDYTSQFGLQGHFFSFLYNKLHISVAGLKLITCTLLTIVLLLISYLISKKYNSLLGVIFYITFLTSPWISAFARNLYWVEFTWFLPVLLALILSMNYSKKKIIVPAIFLAIFVKCLCGYEYISSIMMMTVSFFIFDIFDSRKKDNRKEILKTTIVVSIVCLLGFIVAILCHSVVRGNGNIVEGLNQIYRNDVLRRTFAGSYNNNFNEKINSSLKSNVLEVVNHYFIWSTDIILGVQGEYFNLLFVATIAILIYNAIKKEKNYGRDIIMFIYFLLTTLSWFVLAKAHSYMHMHINYVLWYFGFVQICLYVILKFMKKKLCGEKNC